LSWPELFGLMQIEAGYRPWEMDKVDEDDFADLAAFWRRSGRSPILAASEPEPANMSSQWARAGAAKQPSEAEIKAMVALSNSGARN
jgi:hypothetical protein